MWGSDLAQITKFSRYWNNKQLIHKINKSMRNNAYKGENSCYIPNDLFRDSKQKDMVAEYFRSKTISCTDASNGVWFKW